MDKGNEKRGLIQLICVLLAFGLWLYVTSIENPNKSTDVKGIEVELLNTDILKESALAISPNQEFKVDLRIEGPANSVYTTSGDDFKLTADLGSYALKVGENIIPVKVDNYPKSVNIKSTGVISIKVNIEEYDEKYVDVVSMVNTKFQDNYSEMKSTISPEKVKVSGPQSAVKRVQKVALKGEKSEVASDFTEQFDVIALDASGVIVQGVDIGISKATLDMKVGKGIEVPIKIKYTGTLKEGLSIEKSILSKSAVLITGDETALSGIEYIETEAINLSNITASSEISIKLNIPDNILIKAEDEFVKVNLQMKDSTPITKNIEVPVTFLEALSEYKYTSSNVTLTLEGTKEDLENITSSNVKVEVNVSNLGIGEHTVEWTAYLVNVNSGITLKNNKGNVVITIANLQ